MTAVSAIVRGLGLLSDLAWRAYTELETGQLDVAVLQRVVRHPNQVENGMVPVAEDMREEQAHALAGRGSWSSGRSPRPSPRQRRTVRTTDLRSSRSRSTRPSRAAAWWRGS